MKEGETKEIHTVGEDTLNGSTLPPRNLTPLGSFTATMQQQRRQLQPIRGASTTVQEEASIITTSLDTAVSFGTTITNLSHTTSPSTNTLSDEVSYPYPSTPPPPVAQPQPRVVTPQEEKAGDVANPRQPRLSHGALPQEPPGSGKDSGRRTAPLSQPGAVLDEIQRQHQPQQQQEYAIAEPVASPFHVPDDIGRCFI
jgi:hypothetical protein